MTFRKRLICGLLLAGPVSVPAMAFAGEESSAAIEPLPIISFAPSEKPSDNVPSAWKKSDLPARADIQFKKPEAVIFTDQASAPNEKSKTSAAAPAASKPASAVLAPIAAPAVMTAQQAVKTGPSVSPTSAPSLASTKAASVAPADAAGAAATTEIAAAAAPQKSAAPAAPAAASEAEASSKPVSTPTRDDQIQLVTQLLMDRGVIRADNEEPLPTSPNDANAIANKNGKDSDINDPISGSPYDSGCYDECCPPPPCLFWVGGIEATFLWPDLNSEDGASFAAEEITNDRFDLCTTQDSDVDSMYLSPRIWLGVQGCAWGANVRYWHLNASEGAYDPSIGGEGTWDDYDCGRPDFGYSTCSRLEAYTIDLELTRRFCVHNCWMQAAIGVRHASIENNESVTGLALTDEGLLSGFARANRNARGTGLLLGLYGRKPIHPCSCVNWFYNARLSTLWGPTQTSAETFAAVQASDDDFVAGAASVNGAYTTFDDTLFIGEIQLGLEWNYALCCLPANYFFRTAIEYQRWDGGLGYSNASSFAGIAIDNGSPSESIVSTSASAAEPQMDLFGFTIGTGLTW